MTDTQHQPSATSAPRRERARSGLYALWFGVLAPATLLGVLAAMALSALPSVALLREAARWSEGWPLLGRVVLFAALVGPCYFAFAALACVFGSLVARPLRRGVVEGSHPIYSLQTTWWGMYGLVMGIVHLTLLPRMNPLASVWIRLMGGKCGKRLVCLNPAGFSDLALLDIGDDVVIGSGAVIICHSVTRDTFRLAPVKIERGASIGTYTVILQGVTVGARAVVAPNSTVEPGTTIPSGETWGGVPAVCIRKARERALREVGQ